MPTDRSFGLGAGAILFVLAGVAWWRDAEAVPTILGSLGAAALLLSIAAPRLLHWPNRLWWQFAQALGWFNSRLLLALFFALVITPVGVVLRLAGRNPLRLRSRTTGWRTFSSRHRDSMHFERLY